MPDVLRRGLDWLNSTRRAQMARTVTYSRGADSETVTATLGRTQYELADEAGFPVAAEALDFIISVAEFPADLGRPAVGDRIALDDTQYEVLAVPGEGAWRWSDPYRVTMRIHTKEMEAE